MDSPLDQRLERVCAPLGDRDRALARELVLGVLRHRVLYESVARRHLRPGRQAEPLLIVLALAAHQLFALERIPDHAIGASSGDLLRSLGHPRLVGVANAVVRRLVEDRVADHGPLPPPWSRIDPRAQPRDPARRFDLPPTVAAALAALAPPSSEVALAALSVPSPLCTRTRPGRSLPRQPEPLHREGPWAWWPDPGPVLAGAVANGDCVVMDRAQGAAVELAAVRAGERVLDLCAAPGGKARMLADAGARVIAADRSRTRLERVDPGLSRLAMDGTRPALAPAFDLVVVDAPCSNTGVLARRPEARRRLVAERLAELGHLQRRLLAAAAAVVGSGGRLLYATCSLLPAENEEVVATLDGWRTVASARHWPGPWQAGGWAAVLERR